MQIAPRDIEKEKEDFKELARKRRERELNDIRKILTTAEGRRFLWRQLEEAKVFHTTYTGNSETFFNEGKRFIGLGILNDVMVAKPDAFAQMQKEAASDHLKVKEQKGHTK